jgi:hypothetical protein
VPGAMGRLDDGQSMSRARPGDWGLCLCPLISQWYMTDRYKHTPSSIYTGKMQCACRWVVSVETLSFDSLRRGGHDVACDLRRVLQARTRSVTAHIHVFIRTVMQYKHCWPNFCSHCRWQRCHHARHSHGGNVHRHGTFTS